jgi:hypothetical protein
MEYFGLGSGIWSWLFNLITSINLLEFIGIIILFLNGLVIANLIDPKLNSNVKVAISFPIGFGSAGLVVFVLLLLNIPLNYSVSVLTIISIIIGIIPIKHLIKKFSLSGIRGGLNTKGFNNILKNVDLLFLIVFVIVTYIIVAFIFKTLYWPVFDWDAITTFDYYGRSIYIENSLIPSTLKENLLGTGISYPPLTHLLIAYSYAIGLSSPKTIYVLVFLSTVIGLYSMLRVHVHKLPAILAVLVLVTTPEFISFAGMVKTNSIQVMFTSIGVISFFNYYKLKINGYLYTSIIMISLNAWVRSEGIEFIAVLSVILFLMWLQKETTIKNVLLFILITPILFISWQIFMKINSADFATYIQVELIPYPFYDAEKINLILYGTWKLMINTRYYGYTFYIAFFVFVVNSALYRKNGNYLIITIIALIMILHILILYQFHYKGNNMSWLLKHSYKRYFFNYIPLVCFFIFSSNFMKTIFEKYERLIRIN